MNTLYFGDNLEVLRDKISDKSADLIYLDHTMFQSNKNYNINKFSDGGYAYGK